MGITSGDGQTIFETNCNRWLVEACSYVPGPTSDEVAAQYGFLPAHIVKLSSNENPVGPSKKVLKVIRSSAGQVHRYPDPEANALREVIATKFGLTPRNVLVGPGSSALMMTIVVALTAPGDEILSMQPGFNLYPEIAAIYGRQHRPLVLDEKFDLGVETVWKAITPRTRLIFITRPNNPTSKLVPLNDLQEILRIAADARAIVVSDEAYVEFAGDGTSAVSQLDSDRDGINLLVTRTFSKAYGLADLRLGYVLGPPDAISYLSKGKPKWGTGTLAQQAGIEALRDSAHLQRVYSLVRQGRENLSKAFTKLGFSVVEPPCGNFLMVKVKRSGVTARELADTLCREFGILVRGDFHEEYIRVSVGTLAQNRTLIKSIRRVLEAKPRTGLRGGR